MKIILPLAIIIIGIFVIFYPTVVQQTQLGNLTISRGQVIPTPTPVPSNWLLPDMKLEPPEELYITNSNGVKELRFNTTFANVGQGPLEMRGETDPSGTKTIATQIIQTTTGDPEERVIGEFIYHPTHDHWHVDRYAQFQIYSLDNDGGAQDLLAQTDKFSFCIWDEHGYDLSLPNAPQGRQYPRCPKNIQGNSVGWGDTYTAGTNGQSVDITNVADGRYLIHSKVNADNAIIESGYANNEATAYIEITGNRVRILESLEN